jgi:hypothetical protein
MPLEGATLDENLSSSFAAALRGCPCRKPDGTLPQGRTGTGRSAAFLKEGFLRTQNPPLIFHRMSLQRARRSLLVGLLLSLMSQEEVFTTSTNPSGKPDNPAEKSRALSPEERRVLRDRYQRFRQLAPEQQEQLRLRLREFQNLPADQKEILKRRQEFLAQLTPEQRQRVQRLYQHWQNLPPERRQRLARRLRKLKELPPEERERALSQMPLWQRLDPEPRQAFTDLMDHLPGDPTAH